MSQPWRTAIASELLALSTRQLFHVLLSLADGEEHGYAILKEVEQRTTGTVVLSTGIRSTASSSACSPRA